MSSTDTAAREEIEEVIKRHSTELEAEDLREIADGIQGIADRWEGVSL